MPFSKANVLLIQAKKVNDKKIKQEATILVRDFAEASITTEQLIDGIMELVERYALKAHEAHAPRAPQAVGRPTGRSAQGDRHAVPGATTGKVVW